MAAAEPAMTSATARRIEATAGGGRGSIRSAGRCGDWNTDGDHWKRGTKRRRRTPWRYGGDRHIEPELLGATFQEIQIGDQIERRNVKLGTPTPNRERKVGADPGRLAERQCQRLHGVTSVRPCIRSWLRGEFARGSVSPARRTFA